MRQTRPYSCSLPSTVQKSKIELLEKEIDTLIWEAVEERERDFHDGENKDLLQLILEGAANNDVDKDASRKFIVDNCKNIYFAGHESTAVAASWCLMLLALHPSWQARIRSEMAQVGKATGALNADSLPKLKAVRFVILFNSLGAFIIEN